MDPTPSTDPGDDRDPDVDELDRLRVECTRLTQENAELRDLLDSRPADDAESNLLGARTANGADDRDLLVGEMAHSSADRDGLATADSEGLAAAGPNGLDAADDPRVAMGGSRAELGEPPLTDASPSRIKIRAFRRLFRGRQDVFAVRWESRNGRSGYTPACAHEWDRQLCLKPRIRCAECPQRDLLPLTDEAIRDHLTGRHVIGVYLLLDDDTCWFLAVDFDKTDWRRDVAAFIATCDSVNVPAHVEISRSGSGAHVWLFFDQPIEARLARKLGCALLTLTTAHRHEVGLDSYDRLFPNQDTLPKGGFGNLIAVPLQRGPRDYGRTVFVDRDLRPFPDQWAYLSQVRTMSANDVRRTLASVPFDGDELGARLPLDDGDGDGDGGSDFMRAPWRRPPAGKLTEASIPGPLPKSVRVVIGNLLYIEKGYLPQALLDRLIRLAAFENPEFYRAQAMRLPTYDKPRLISCAEELPLFIGLPRGCLDAVADLLDQHGISTETIDEREPGHALNVTFHGTLTAPQEEAARAMLAHEMGVLCAATAFGKTVVAAWLIAARATNTLVLVHRRQLMDQWRERLGTFLDLPPKEIGLVGGGRSRLTGMLDVAVIQSLNKKGVVDDLVADYGQVIVDECHHISAFSFETVLRQAKARYVLGLTATPRRRDGHHPIIVMQCGPIRHRTDRRARATSQPFGHLVVPHRTAFRLPETPSGPAAAATGAREIGIQTIYNLLAADVHRNDLIVAEVLAAVKAGRSPLVLTERTEHRDMLAERLTRALSCCSTEETGNGSHQEPTGTTADDAAPRVFVLSGGMGTRKRRAIAAAMAATPPDAPRVVVATGRCVGEGFDDSRLDTLFLAMPVAWRGTLQQYAGRLHRAHAGKDVVTIHDFVDDLVPVLARMYEKRLRGYRAMGYTLRSGEQLVH
jgi:superfamily II DNA or RNA helicase